MVVDTSQDVIPNDVPAADVPTADVPAADVPTADVPAADVPAADVPAADVPAADVPAADVPATDVPATDTTVPDDAALDVTVPDATVPDVTQSDVTLTDVPRVDVVDAASDAPAPRAALTAVINQLGGPGNLDGVGAEVRFNDLNHAVYDGSRYLYTIERCAVRRVDTTAAYAVALFAGDPYDCTAVDGPRASARFPGLSQVAIDGTSALYISEAAAQRIRKIDLSTGLVTTFAGALGMTGTADGPGTTARFNTPRGLAIIGRALFVADEGNVSLRRIDLDAGTVTTVAGAAGTASLRLHVDGVGAAARFMQPSWLTSDGVSRLFLVEVTANTVRRIDLPSYTVTTIAGTPGVASGFVDGVGAAARFYFPFGVTMADPNTLVVTDNQNAALRRVDVNTGAVTTLVGGPRLGDVVDGDAAAARVFGPYSPAMVGGVVMFPDFNGFALRGLTLATGAVRTYASTTRRLSTQVQTFGVTTDGRRTFIGRLGTIDEIDLSTGAFTTLVGDPASYTTVDGVGPAARLYGASGLTYGDGALYWFEAPRYVVRRMDLATRTVTTLAGTSGMIGSVDGVGPAARFDFIGDIAYAGGAVYVAESNTRVVRRVDVATRAVTTVLGTRYATSVVDGVGDAARFSNPFGLETDGADALFIGDGSTLRRADLSTLRVTTVAGSITSGYLDAVGTAARLGDVNALAYEPGYVYFTDAPNSMVRRFEVATARVTTSLGVAGLHGVRLGPLPTSLSGPNLLLSIGAGDLLIRDETSLLRARGL